MRLSELLEEMDDLDLCDRDRRISARLAKIRSARLQGDRTLPANHGRRYMSATSAAAYCEAIIQSNILRPDLRQQPLEQVPDLLADMRGAVSQSLKRCCQTSRV